MRTLLAVGFFGFAVSALAATEAQRQEALNYLTGPLCTTPLDQRIIDARCADSDSTTECYRRLTANKPNTTLQESDAIARTGEDVIQDLTNLVSPLPIPGLGGAVAGLLPGLYVAGLQTVGRSLPDPHTLGLAASDSIPGFSRNFDWFTASFSGFLVPKPTINPVLKAKLVDLQRADQLEALEGDSNPLHDGVYEVQLIPQWRWWGRTFTWAEPELATLYGPRMTDVDVVHAVETAGGESDSGNGDEMGRLNIAAGLGHGEFLPVSAPGMRRALSCAAGAALKNTVEVRRRVQEKRIGEYYKLIYNQPQLVLSHKELRRSGAVGANAHSSRATFSMGINNSLDWLRLSSECTTELADTNRGSCSEKYKQMLDNFFTRHAVAFSAYFETGGLNAFSFDIPAAASGVPLPPTGSSNVSVPGGRFRERGMSLGMFLTEPHQDSNGAVARSNRMDLAYDDVRFSDHLYRLDYSVVRLTLTYRIGAVSVPINLYYRTNAEFNVEALGKLGAGIGAGMTW